MFATHIHTYINNIILLQKKKLNKYVDLINLHFRTRIIHMKKKKIKTFYTIMKQIPQKKNEFSSDLL